MGVQLNHQLLRLPEAYGINQTFTGEFGFNYSLNSDWSMGLAVFNIGRNKLTEIPDDRYSTSMRLGTKYQISDKTLILAELEKAQKKYPKYIQQNRHKKAKERLR